MSIHINNSLKRKNCKKNEQFYIQYSINNDIISIYL